MFFSSPPPKINFKFNLKLVCIVTKNGQKFCKKMKIHSINLRFILGVKLVDFLEIYNLMKLNLKLF